MKRVLLVTRPISPPWNEASKNFAYYLAKSAKNFSFSLLTPGFVEELPEDIEQISIYTNGDLHMKWSQRLRLLKLAPMVKKFDIVHFMLTPSKLNAPGFKLFLSSKRAKTVQTIATLREDLLQPEDFKKILFADELITYSDYAKNKLISYGFQNVTRIYPGIDLEKYQFQIKDDETLKRFNLNSNDFVVMFNGEYVRLGATDDIVSALPDLFKKIPNAKFVFANRIKDPKDVIKRDDVKKTLQELGIIDKVVFTDSYPDIQDMSKIYNMADVVVFPVRNMFGKFDVPLVVIESMACEKPVVISDLTILKEFANNENTAIIEAGNMQQFVSKIVELSKNAYLRDQLGMAGRKYVEENFDIKNVAMQYEQVYTKLSQ